MSNETNREIQVPEGLIKPEVQLSGHDGNAMFIIGTVRRELRRVGNRKDVLDAFTSEAMSGDYDHVLLTCMTYADVS